MDRSASFSTSSIRSSRADITPEQSFELGGYAARSRSNVGEDQPLEANVLEVRAPGVEPMAWVSIDALAVTPLLRMCVGDALAAVCGLRADRIVVIATHTHSAPSIWLGTVLPALPAQLDVRECRRVAERIAAAHVLSPVLNDVTVESETTSVVGVGSNRRNRGLPIDRTQTTVMVRSEGREAAVISSYACHATVLGPDNVAYSPDWVGYSRLHVRAAFRDSSLPVLYFPGAAGDISTRFERRDRTLAEADRLGAIFASAMVGAVERAIAHPLLVADVSRTELVVAGHTMPVARTRLGDRGWVHTPLEIVDSLGRVITRGAPNIRLVGYSDGYSGYLADRGSHRRDDYEASASRFDWSATSDVVCQLRALVIGMS